MSPRDRRDDESRWVVLSADAIVALVAFGDREFAKLEAGHRAQRDALAAAAERKKQTTRSPK